MHQLFLNQYFKKKNYWIFLLQDHEKSELKYLVGFQFYIKSKIHISLSVKVLTTSTIKCSLFEARVIKIKFY